MNTAIGSRPTSWWWLRIRSALYMLAAPDFLTFINEFESLQNHRNSSDVHHNFHESTHRSCKSILDVVHVVIDTGDVMGA